MKNRYFSTLLPELATRATRATVSRLGFSNPALRAHLTELFSAGYGEKGCFLGDPVFEATFGWEEASAKMENLAPGLLTPSLVEALDKPGGGKSEDYRFPKTAHPYRHQLEAWNILCSEKPQSVVVTSGTGSGKTECFMVPILNQLARQYESRKAKLVGVEALFLYPLNALIQSQRERLDAWTASFDDGVRFCLYNGLTPQTEKQFHRDQTPNQVIDREALRAAPPPILVTNATMLEYMLVRAQDASILDASKGKLKWIVLDEAHTYIGSQAAELALLLRRVLHAFGVTPEQVRFVATSATIGGKESEEQLREFLARLSGLPLDQVHVVSGTRKIPLLEGGNSSYASASLDELEVLQNDSNERYEALCANKVALGLRGMFVPPAARATNLSEIKRTLFGSAFSGITDSTDHALRWLDLLTATTKQTKSGTTPFLPLRLHAFHNVLQGLWACSDSDCHCKRGTALEADEWQYGMVYGEPRQHCDCGSPVYELRSCNDCNTTYLWARRVLNKVDARYRLVQGEEDTRDEFSLDVEVPEEEKEEADRVIDDSPVLIANGYQTGTAEVLLARESLILDPVDTDDVVKLRVRDETPVGEDGDIAMVCPECGGQHGRGTTMFRAAILGAPFLLGEIIPTLLEFCPDIENKEVKPLDRPLRGRRMISFTDSRQGTARIAAKLQQDSERNRVRGLVLKKVLASGAAAASAEASNENKDIENLKAALKVSPNPIIQKMLDEKLAKLAQSATIKPVPFAEIAEWLSTSASDVKDWMHDYYVSLDPVEFAANSGRERLARILLMREFARRPKRVNSLETMGLVRTTYPKLDAVVRVPDFPPGLPAFSLSDWKDFLKIALDFHVRENTFIDLPDSWRKWGGNRLSAKQLLPPDSKELQTNKLKRWPQSNPAGRQSRLVRLLAYVCKLDAESSYGKEIIDCILRSAWDQLIAVGLLHPGGIGRYLTLNDVALAPIEKAWVCPVTRRILDVTFRGVTPYLPEKAVSPSVADCRAVTIPRCDLVLQDFPSDDQRIDAIRDWVNGNESVDQLRREGLWSDLNDRILEGGTYFRTAEHSAQQPGARLAEYESQFKTGKINLLSCSTTMEMGVDIGGISVVAMNNVPPHPANYLQRAGRAGRRGETRSVSLALCKNNPHDQNVFSNTLWAFNTELPAPAVLLSSSILIQRHINSMLLAAFLRKELSGSGSADKLSLEWWMLPKDSARLQRFCAWASCFDPFKEPHLAQGLRSLLRHTPHEGTASLDRLAQEAARMAGEHAVSWYAEFDAIEGELDRFPISDANTSPAFKALTIQKKRLTAEYLLRELATEGFLPGYGFPTDISSFETLTCDELERNKNRRSRSPDEPGRIDNRMRFRDLPSRDTVTALREYAPGSEVVIDGLVYRSAGITLNWHAPASVTDITEIQNIREAWRCRNCGSSGTSVRAKTIHECPDCGAALVPDPETRFTYLEPAGFSVDLYDSPHNDVSTQSFVPVASPWVNALGEWLPLVNPGLGLYRSSNDGMVFNYSSGTKGHGYALCLTCGRAEPMDAADQLPVAFVDLKTGKPKEHNRLRGAQGGDSRICEGSYNSFAVMPSLRLGHETHTDVLELLLYGLDGLPLRDKQVAFTLAVAIRNAIARLLGIESSELGCDTKPVKIAGISVSQAIVIFDNNASGYCSSVADKLQQLFVMAKDELECVNHCHDACQHCLLDFDTRFRSEDLNRHAALAFVSEDWMKALALPEEYAYFGKAKSTAEHQSLPEAITRELATPSTKALRIYLAGDASDWDIAASPLRRWITRWAVAGNELQIVMPGKMESLLSPPDKSCLNSLCVLDGVSIWVGSPPACASGGFVAAELLRNDGSVAWATASIGMAMPAGAWGEPNGSTITRGTLPTSGSLDHQLKLEAISPIPVSERTHRLELKNELDGPVIGFGKRLLSALEAELGEALFSTNADIVEVTYHDRYLNSPLPVSLLLEFISGVKTVYADRWGVTKFDLMLSPFSEEPRPGMPPNKIWHNWPHPDARDRAIEAAFGFSGIEASVISRSKQDAIHARRLDFTLDNGDTVQIWFDQGCSYWQIPRSNPGAGRSWFPFDKYAEAQGEAIALADARVEGQAFPTYVFVGR